MKNDFTNKSISLVIVGTFIAFIVLTSFQNCSGSSSGSDQTITLTTPNILKTYSASYQIALKPGGQPSEVVVEVTNADGSTNTSFKGTAKVSDSSNLFCSNEIVIENGKGVGKIYAVNNGSISKSTTVSLSVTNFENPSDFTMDLGTTVQVLPRVISTEKMTISGQLPNARSFHTAIYEPLQKRMIVFGGRESVISGSTESNQSIFNDVWSYTPASNQWDLLATTNTPEARYLHAAVLDTKRNRMLVFGGKNISGAKLNDFWSLDLTTLVWSQITITGVGPAARSGSALHYKEDTDRVLVLTGGSTADNVWSLSFDTATQAHWTKHTASGDEPNTTIQTTFDVRSSLAFIPNLDELILTPRTLSATNFNWSISVAPYVSDTFNGSLVYDSVNRQTVAAGGGCCLSLDASGSAGNYSLNTLNLGLDGSKTFPIALHGHSAVYDPESLKMIVYGGETVSKSNTTPIVYKVAVSNDIYNVSLPRKDCP